MCLKNVGIIFHWITFFFANNYTSLQKRVLKSGAKRRFHIYIHIQVYIYMMKVKVIIYTYIQ